LFVFCFKLDNCLRMNNNIGQNSKGYNLRCMDCVTPFRVGVELDKTQ
jgi:hypothetical protein